MTMVSRDPFARTEVHRRKEVGHNGCDWCGASRTHKGVKTWALFRYSTESDGERRNDHKGLFCCKSCHDAYHA